MRNKCIVLILAAFFISLSFWNIFGEKQSFSESERRKLETFPEVSVENILSGDFGKDFEDYMMDHFPKRDSWRTLKAYAKTKILGQKDNNGLYQADGHLSKIEYPMNTQMIDHAIEVFDKVQKNYLTDHKVYLAVIPDKNRFLAPENGYLSMDYDKFSEYVNAGMNEAEYIEIADLLEAEDYYRTDSHWRQECITDIAEKLAHAMGAEISAEYEVEELKQPFYGVYVGQSALKCEPDTICYLENETIRQLKVEGADAVYDMKKANGRDPYEMFLSGNQPVITIRNEKVTDGKRLILFRDSFGSSIAPLLSTGYSEVVLIDLRYISSNMIGEYVDFKDADVLFLYSTMMLNQSFAIK